MTRIKAGALVTGLVGALRRVGAPGALADA
ncbi:hypothetical protein GA0115240_15531, partial [Streptomyces sp. DvalAA-14]